jgi:predicted glycosyltransferase
MRVSIEVGHPGHVHYWKNVYWGLQNRNHEVRIYARDKEICLQILEALGIPYTPIGRNQPGLLRKVVGVLSGDWLLWRAARSFRPDVMVSGTSVYSAHVSRLLRCRHVGLLDTHHAHLILRTTVPCTDVICTPSSYEGPLPEERHRTFRGCKELMYLRPDYFSPDATVLEDAGVDPREPYILARLSSWDASHDVGDSGLDLGIDGLRSFFRHLERLGRVFLTSEVELPTEFGKYSLPVAPELIHHLLAFASLYIGEGAVMASESGVLGVPWVYVSTTGRCYLQEQQKRFGLGWHVRDADAGRALADEVLARPKASARQEWQRKRQAFLDATDDVTEFMIHTIEEVGAGAVRSAPAARQAPP